METISSGRKWTARVLLALAWLWIVFKFGEVISQIKIANNLGLPYSSYISVNTLDVSNPSPLGIVGFFSFIAYFFVRPKK